MSSESAQTDRLVLEMPLSAICAYVTDDVAKEGRGELCLNLIRAHRSVIIAGPAGGLASSYWQIRKNATMWHPTTVWHACTYCFKSSNVLSRS